MPPAVAQPYGNEWVDYEQSYYRIKVHTDGVYRISYDALQSAGIPVSSISPNQFEITGREEEQMIHIAGGDDGSFDPGDHIEFYGRANDGWLDSLMYADPSWIGNPYYSLVNDTIHYFLSWNADTNHPRFTVESGTDFQNYLSPNSLEYTSRQVNKENYNFGVLLLFNNNIPDYAEGEGWMGARFGKGAGSLERAVLLPTANKSIGTAPNAIGRTVFASANNASAPQDNHHIRVYRGANDAVQLANLSFHGYQLNAVDFSIPHGQVNEMTRINHKVIDDLEAVSDHFRIAYTELTYSHGKNVSDLSTLEFEVVRNNSQDKFHVDLRGIGYESPVIYSFGEQGYRITGQTMGDTLDFLLPNQTIGKSRIFITDASGFIDSDLEPVSGNAHFTDFASLSPDSAFIIVTHPSLMGSAQQYANYRTNSFRDAVLVDVEELYDQFGGGIPKHFFGIRRFCDLALDEWESRPGHLFLLGKSIFLHPQNQTAGGRKDSTLFANTLVPSFGSPGSDILFTSGLDGGGLTPAIPTGRLSAITNFEVLDYLQKVVSNETRGPAPWMKNVIHFGGGSNANEQQNFANHLAQYEALIEDTCFGGNVSTFLKTTSVPIELNLSDSISDIIAEGLSIITFFGHAGGGQFDQSIDDPENLEWGSHPLVIINSCYSGDVHAPGHPSASESYTILPDKGAIAFVASVQLGFESRLHQYSTELYRHISQKNYGRSIGYLMQQTIEDLSAGGQLQGEARASILMNLLQGDPAVPVFSPEQPDLAIDETSVSFFPEEVTASLDSITVQVAVTNIGKTTNIPFGIELLRVLPDGSESVFQEQLPFLYFRDTVEFRIPTDFANGFGINQFKVSVDLPNNAVPEIDNFLNNRVTVELPITDGGVFPVIPYEFAIIPDNQVTLKASTGNPFIEERDYSLEIDTTDLFDSPLLLTHAINQIGGVLSWDVPMTLTDSTVYYWRVAETLDDPSEMSWRESSFQYIDERVGWGQAHYFQFKGDQFNTIDYDRPERDFDFFSGTKLLSCQVIGNVPAYETEYYIDFNTQEYAGCTGAISFHVAVIDPITLEPWGKRFNGENPNNFFGNANDNGSCRNRVEYYFIFRQNNAEQMESFQNMLENEIPDGHIVLVYTWVYGSPASWVTSFPDASEFFASIGAEEIAQIDDNLPFAYAYVKGDPSSGIEAIGDTVTSLVELNFPMTATGNTGSILSPIIGPAVEWNTLYWGGSDFSSSDTAHIELIGINAAGVETPIAGGSFDFVLNDEVDLSLLVNALEYSRLRVKAYLHDPVNLDPIQLDRWQILYEPVPEAALNPNLGFSFYNDTIQEGEDVSLISTIENISALDMDSLLVNYWIQTQSNEIIEIPYPRQAPLLVGDALTDSLTFSSLGLRGTNTLWVEANPRVPPAIEYDQLEQYHFNNLGQLRFFVDRDRENPILDVTFDGQHILDGDLVSTQPQILIRLDDENPFLLMNEPGDTLYFSVFLTDPQGTQKRIYFQDGMGNEILSFIPADGVDNVADILYRPDLVMDGTYTILVTASDKSGNASGDINYRISFSVDHASSITEVLNYPNPFSTRTHFVFTLTGTTVPDYMKIQILTVTGKVVKEIHKEELGDLHIGRNITDYTWDGTDTYGDRLANGVYLYRVIVRDNGENLDVRATGASTFFKKGFGKMYLLR